MKRWLRARLRPFLANFYYIRRPLVEFLPIIVLVGVILAVGGWLFHHLYEKEPLTYWRALYITYCLIFMEHLIEFPDHWILRAFYFLLPLLGLIIILDGLTRFGYHVLRRDENRVEWIRAMAKTYKDHVILCGLGRVGLRTLQQLLRLNEEVVILEKNEDNQNNVFAKKKGLPILIGSGREEGILEELNVKYAKSIILATDDDLANLEMAMDARKINPAIRVVLRMFDQELASKIEESFDIHLAFSTSSLAAPLFATCSSDRSIENAFYVDDTLLVVAHLTINPESTLIGKKIRDLGSQHEIFFLRHRSGTSETKFPAADTPFAAGDQLVVQTTPATLRELHKWNKDKQPY